MRFDRTPITTGAAGSISRVDSASLAWIAHLIDLEREDQMMSTGLRARLGDLADTLREEVAA